MEWPPWYLSSSEELSFVGLDQARAELVPTGIHAFDRHFGGLAVGQIYEITGEAGSGKTNFSLQISKNICELQNSQVFFISTQKPLSQSRLRSIGIDQSKFLNHYSPSLSEFFKLFNEDLPEFAKNLKLLVLDNIYSLVNHEELTDRHLKSQVFQRIAVSLKYLSLCFKFGVIIVNNVVSDMNQSVCPGLGIAWSYCVNHRIFLSKGHDRKVLRVIFSNCKLAVTRFSMTISNDQVELEEEVV
jgi:predicted ATP-dependent serine protease